MGEGNKQMVFFPSTCPAELATYSLFSVGIKSIKANICCLCLNVT